MEFSQNYILNFVMDFFVHPAKLHPELCPELLRAASQVFA